MTNGSRSVYKTGCGGENVSLVNQTVFLRDTHAHAICGRGKRKCNAGAAGE